MRCIPFQADERFHQLVGTASGMGTAVEVYQEMLAELYDFFIPCPIEKLHKSKHDHIALVAALRAGKVEEAVEVSRRHVDLLRSNRCREVYCCRREAFTIDEFWSSAAQGVT